jgi:hypothetical protein
MWDILLTGTEIVGGTALLFASLSRLAKTKKLAYLIPGFAGLAMALMVAVDFLAFYADGITLLEPCSDYVLLIGGAIVYLIMLRAERKSQKTVVEAEANGSLEAVSQNPDAQARPERSFPFATSAFGLAEVAMFVLAFVFAAVVYTTFYPGSDPYNDVALSMVRPILCVYALVVPLSLAGIALGAVAFRRSGQNKAIASMGIAFNGVFLCIFAISLLLLLTLILPGSPGG